MAIGPLSAGAAPFRCSQQRQPSTIAAHCVEKTARDQGAVGFRPVQAILLLFQIILGRLGRVVDAAPAESCSMRAKHRFAVTARAGMNEQAKTLLVQAEGGKRRCVRYALDAL